MMEFNTPLSIEQVSNGFVVRPLSQSGEAKLSMADCVVIPKLSDLLAYLNRHFESQACPKCGKATVRQSFTPMFMYSGRYVMVHCERCHISAPDRYRGEWIPMPDDSTASYQNWVDRMKRAFEEKAD